MGRNKKEGWIIREKVLNNKSRKGKYAYIKLGGKRASYYKIDKDYPLKDSPEYYISLYEGNLGKGRVGVKSRKDKVSKVLKTGDFIEKGKVQKKAIDRIIGKGIWSTQLNDAFTKTPNDIREFYKELLMKAILSRDEDTFNLLIQDQNIQKLKSRFEFKISLLDSSGSELAYLEHIGRKDMEEVISDMKRLFGKGKMISKEYDKKAPLVSKEGYGYFPKESGKVESVDIRLIMRKAK